MKQLIITAIVTLTLVVAMLSTQAQSFRVLHQFDSQDDGAFPEGAVLRDAKGHLYGTTTLPGTVFKIDRKGREPLSVLSTAAI